MSVAVRFKMSGAEVIRRYLAEGKKDEVVQEINDLKQDCVQAAKGEKQLKDFDKQWPNLTRYEKINKGKKFKEYVNSRLITEVEIVSNKAN